MIPDIYLQNIALKMNRTKKFLFLVSFHLKMLSNQKFVNKHVTIYKLCKRFNVCKHYRLEYCLFCFISCFHCKIVFVFTILYIKYSC